MNNYNPAERTAPQTELGHEMAPALEYAGIATRFFANLIDNFFALFGMIPGAILFVILTNAGDENSTGTADILSLISLILLLGGYLVMYLFNIYLLGRDGATVGKRLMGIKVLGMMGQPLGFGKALGRELIKFAIANTFAPLLLWPLWDGEKQGLYDKALGSHVYKSMDIVTLNLT